MFCVAIVDKSFPIFDHFIVQFQFVSFYGYKGSLIISSKEVSRCDLIGLDIERKRER
jgi:hypothetical protein